MIHFVKISSNKLLHLIEKNALLIELIKRCSSLLKKAKLDYKSAEKSLSSYLVKLDKKLEAQEKKLVSQTDENHVSNDILLIGLMNLQYRRQKNQNTKLMKINKEYRDLLRMISHEFKNSLTSIHGYNRILHKRLSETDKTELAEITANIDRLAGNLYGLVDSLYGASMFDDSKKKLNYRVFDLDEDALQPILAEMELRLKKKNMQIILHKKFDKNIFYGDEILFQAVFRNLILNAVQYGNEGTEINIDIREDDKKYIISVKNLGNNLEHLNNKSIFNKYSRFHQEKEKTNIGIGLYVVKRIVRLYKGTISVKTDLTHSVKFILMFPKQIKDG